MRLSANEGSPYFQPAARLDTTRVYLDGVAIPMCVEASEEEGWADVVVGGNGDTGPEIERHFGPVKIVLGADDVV